MPKINKGYCKSKNKMKEMSPKKNGSYACNSATVLRAKKKAYLLNSESIKKAAREDYAKKPT